jgi:hypothetical protein
VIQGELPYVVGELAQGVDASGPAREQSGRASMLCSHGFTAVPVRSRSIAGSPTRVHDRSL